MKKICFLTSSHPRFEPRIFQKMCLSTEDSYDTSLVVSDSKGFEIFSKVNIYDVGKIKNKFFKMIVVPYLMLIKVNKINPNIVHFHDPELLLIAPILKLLGFKVIYDCHENYDLQIDTRQWIPNIFKPLFKIFYLSLEKLTFPFIDKIIFPQPAMVERYKNYSEKTQVISNFPEESYLKNINLNKKVNKKVIYTGGISEERGIFNILSLVEHMPDYEFTIAGYVEPSLLRVLKKNKIWNRINYFEFITDSKSLQKLYSTHSFGLILFNNVGQYYMSYSLKLFEYMANGLTVIMPNFGNWKSFNETYKVGLSVEVSNSLDIAQRINKLSEDDMLHFRLNNNKLVNKVFNWETQKKLLLTLYKKMLDD